MKLHEECTYHTTKMYLSYVDQNRNQFRTKQLVIFEEFQMHNLGLGLRGILGLGLEDGRVPCHAFVSYVLPLPQFTFVQNPSRVQMDRICCVWTSCDRITNRVNISNYENALVSPVPKIKPNQKQTMGPSKRTECKTQNTH